MNEAHCLVMYFGAAIVGFSYGVLAGYLYREGKYWSEVEKKYRAIRHGGTVR